MMARARAINLANLVSASERGASRRSRAPAAAILGAKSQKFTSPPRPTGHTTRPLIPSPEHTASFGVIRAAGVAHLTPDLKNPH